MSDYSCSDDACRERAKSSVNREMARIQEDIRRLRFWRSLLAEFLGTLFLVLIGCGAWADKDSNTHLFVVKVALAFGLTLAAVLYCVRSLGEAHLNPAVSLAMLITKRTSVVKLILFVVCQMLGAIIGAAFVLAVTKGSHEGTGCTVPADTTNDGQGFGVEFFATFFYVFVVFSCHDKAKKGEQIITPFITGLTYSAVLLFAIPYTGGSANTARSFGPALVNNVWKGHWIYWFGPLFGGIAGGGVYDLIFSTKASFKRLHACLFVFHRREPSPDDPERAPEEEEEIEGEAGPAVRKDTVVSSGDEEETPEGERGKEYPPGGPGGRHKLRDLPKPKMPKLHRPKFTCCGGDTARKASPPPPISPPLETPLEQAAVQSTQEAAPTIDSKETQTSESEQLKPTS